MEQVSLPTEGTFHGGNKSLEKEKPMLGAIGMAVNYSVLSPTVKNPHHEHYGKQNSLANKRRLSNFQGNADMIHVLADAKTRKIRHSPSHPRLKTNDKGNTSHNNSSVNLDKKAGSQLDDSVEIGSINDSFDESDVKLEDKDINNSLILRQTFGKNDSSGLIQKLSGQFSLKQSKVNLQL